MVLNENVGGVGFEGEVVIAGCDDPIAGCDVVRKHYIGTISVERREVEANVLRGISAVDVDVLKQDVLGVDDSHRPHLALHKAGLLDNTVRQAFESDLMRSAREATKLRSVKLQCRRI